MNCPSPLSDTTVNTPLKVILGVFMKTVLPGTMPVGRDGVLPKTTLPVRVVPVSGRMVSFDSTEGSRLVLKRTNVGRLIMNAESLPQACVVTEAPGTTFSTPNN